MIERDDARPRTMSDALGYAQTKLLRQLPRRSPRVDLVELDDDRPPPGATFVVVYRREQHSRH